MYLNLKRHVPQSWYQNTSLINNPLTRDRRNWDGTTEPPEDQWSLHHLSFLMAPGSDPAVLPTLAPPTPQLLQWQTFNIRPKGTREVQTRRCLEYSLCMDDTTWWWNGSTHVHTLTWLTKMFIDIIALPSYWHTPTYVFEHAQAQKYLGLRRK